MLRHLRRLVTTAWVGSLWAIGYIAAPTLFMTLEDRTLAGTIAGSLFHTEAWLSLACAALLAVLIALTMRVRSVTSTGTDGMPAGGRSITQMQHRKQLWLIAAMALCTLVGYFGLQPFMAAIRVTAAAAGGMSADARMHFGVLHGLASGIYLGQSVLGGWLLLKMD